MSGPVVQSRWMWWCVQAINDLLSCVNDVDMALVDMMRHEFGERSLPATVSTILALRRLDINTLSSLAYLDSPSVNSVSRQHSFAGIDDFAALFLRVAQTVCDSGEQTAAKRRRYDDDDDINNLSSSSEMHLHQNQTWNSAADYHKHLQLWIIKYCKSISVHCESYECLKVASFQLTV